MTHRNHIVFDTEFIEDGRTIDLLSIGMVRISDGATYYAEPLEADRSKASPWVREHVLPHLQGGRYLRTRHRIAAEIQEFVGTAPTFWAWYADYDWVALCQLYGTMMDLPRSWPMFCMDFRQVVPILKGSPVVEHNALSDAQHLAGQMLDHYGDRPWF